jgi:hypothetical protein
MQVESYRPICASYFQYVAKSACRHQCCVGAVPLHKCIDDMRGTVFDNVDLVERDAHLAQANDDAFHQVAIGGERFAKKYRAPVPVIRDDVCKSTTGVSRHVERQKSNPFLVPA